MYDEWRRDYEKFKRWAIENGYNDKLTIDRIDNNGNYTPSNCRWTDMKTQGRNKRDNRLVEYQGRSITMAELVEITKIPESTLRNRLKKGISLELPRYFNRKPSEGRILYDE